jgi:hypothetical protein
MPQERARIIVEWGYECHAITLTARNWARIKAGKPLRIRGEGYWYEGDHFWDYWSFAGGLDGRLVVSYHSGTEWEADGWIGTLGDAEIETFTDREPDHAPYIPPVATWIIQRDGEHLWLRRMLHGGGLPPRWDMERVVGSLDELRALVPPGLRPWTPDDPSKTPIVESWS